MMRAHFYRPFVDNSGRLFEYAEVRVLAEDEDFLGQVVWRDPDGTVALANPFICSPATIEFYLDNPQRVVLMVTTPGNGPMYLRGMDVLPDAHEVVRATSPVVFRDRPAPERTVRMHRDGRAIWGDFAPEHYHESEQNTSVVVLGPDVVQPDSGDDDALIIGSGAGASGASTTGAVMLGPLAAATGPAGVALGYENQAPLNSVAIGRGALGSGESSVAIGRAARAAQDATCISYTDLGARGARSVALSGNADQPDSIAIGDSSSALTARSVAVGSNARIWQGEPGGVQAPHVLLGYGAPYNGTNTPPAPVPGGSDAVVSWRGDTVLPGGLQAVASAVIGSATGRVGLFGAPAVTQPTVVGDVQVNRGLSLLLRALTDLGLIVRTTTNEYIPAPLPPSGRMVDDPVHPVFDS